jgi:hypothetical protein
LVAGAAALAGCGGEAKPTRDEVNAGYLQVAEDAIANTFMIDRATEDPPDRPGRLAREFRGFADNVDYTATFLLTVSDLGPVGAKAFVFGHSLGIYESALLAVVRRVGQGDRTLTRLFRGVRQAGAGVRVTGAAWEQTLRAAIAD